jgi:YHS domain-containing protein
MLFEDLLWLIVSVVVARMVWRLVDGAMDGMRSGVRRPEGPARPPSQGVHMERDPICGTFVVPDHALSLTDGSGRVYFCSTACRDKYRAKTA